MFLLIMSKKKRVMRKVIKDVWPRGWPYREAVSSLGVKPLFETNGFDS